MSTEFSGKEVTGVNREGLDFRAGPWEFEQKAGVTRGSAPFARAVPPLLPLPDAQGGLWQTPWFSGAFSIAWRAGPWQAHFRNRNDDERGRSMLVLSPIRSRPYDIPFIGKLG